MPRTAASASVSFFEHFLLVRNRDAQALDAPGGRVVDEPQQVLARHADRDVHLVQLPMAESGVVDLRTETVADRVGDHPVDLGLGVDLVVVVDLGHLLVAQLAGGQRPLVMERGVGERRAELAGENPRGDADVAHAQADRRHLAAAGQLQQPQVVVRMIGHRADLDDVGIELAHPAVDVVEIVGRLAEVVQADDPLGAAETRNRRGDVLFQVDVVHALGDRAPQQQQPLILAAGKLPAVDGPAAGDDHRARPVGHQPPQVHLAVDVVQPQFDQLGALVDQVPMLRNHVSVPAAANADADHGEGRGVRDRSLAAASTRRRIGCTV